MDTYIEVLMATMLTVFVLALILSVAAFGILLIKILKDEP